MQMYKMRWEPGQLSLAIRGFRAPNEQDEDFGADLGGSHRDEWGDHMSETGPDDVRRRISLRTARMEALSDGIFAIAATLLVLDLAIPAVTSKDVGHQLVEQRPPTSPIW
jgi:Endosomal/lysosomal potassium channel TMEM175